jgi:hypothetical protein
MSIQINYLQYESPDWSLDRALDSSLTLDGVGFEPERYYDTFDPSKTIYHSCPAWQHKVKREFVIRAPKHIELRMNREEQFITSNIEGDLFHQIIQPPPNWEVDQTFQIHIPIFLMWTRSKNVWVEQKQCNGNNFKVVEGWWNLSDWSRPIGFAINFIDESKPIIIRRGDPIYRVAFSQEHNHNQTYDMVKSTPTSKQLRDAQKRVDTKNLFPRITHKLIFNSTKCPFKLWQK